MKYAIASCIVFAFCLLAGMLMVRLAQRVTHAHWPRRMRVILSAVCGLAIMVGASMCYLQQHYHATPEATGALSGSDIVEVQQTSNGWLFDGPGTQTALVFYPGAKVEAAAYAPLMSRVASMGIDCFLVRMPMRLAVLDANAADELLDEYDYDHWIVGGHSMGGLSAAMYTSGHADRVDGLALLAAYATQPIDDSVVVVSIYGDCDGILNFEEYEKTRGNLPSDANEVIIEGGNHSGFGNYGQQRGDGQATISSEIQQKQTTSAIARVGTELQGS